MNMCVGRFGSKLGGTEGGWLFGSHCPEERQLSLDFVWFIFIQKQSVSRLSSVFSVSFDSVLSLPFALATVSGFHPPQCRCMWWILFLEERNVGGEKRETDIHLTCLNCA